LRQKYSVFETGDRGLRRLDETGEAKLVVTHIGLLNFYLTCFIQATSNLSKQSNQLNR
jgi:hypothetical protein